MKQVIFSQVFYYTFVNELRTCFGPNGQYSVLAKAIYLKIDFPI
jgi:hypothetical protein